MRCIIFFKGTNENISKDNLIDNYSKILILLNPFIPHFSSECLEELSKYKKIQTENWPKVDAKFLKIEEINLVVQINGRKRDILRVKNNENEDEILKIIHNNEKLKNFIKDKKIIKKIFIPNKIINLIIQ